MKWSSVLLICSFSFCIYNIAASDLKTEVGNIALSCMEENGVKLLDIENIKNLELKPEDVQNNVKCAAKCVLMKANAMDNQGQLNVEAVRQHFAQTSMLADVEEALRTCGSLEGNNSCDTAYAIVSCLSKANIQF